MVAFGIAIMNTYKISRGDGLYDAAAQQSSYKLKVASMRGNIYDCNKKPLVGEEQDTIISVIPNINTPSILSKLLSEDEKIEAFEKIKSGKPFTLKLLDNKQQIIASGINTFKVPRRYSQSQLAEHIVGYIDSDMQGVCGIEKAFNDYLSDAKGSIFVKYKVDAINRRIPGENIIVDNTMYKHSKGVVLTIDKKIQKIAQNAAQKYIKKGAILVTQVPNCEIRACVSMPSFSPTNISEVLNDKDSPLLNRAFLPYNVGSVFKLITAAAILNSNENINKEYDCIGKCNVDGHEFHCFNGKGHGKVNLEKAVALSCNTYFIEKALAIGGDKILDLAEKMGFSREIELAPGIISKKGILPQKESLINKRALANFSFGQGKLLTTPLQIAALMNTIASDGYYCEPNLVLGLVNESLNYIQKTNQKPREKILSSECVKNLTEYMKASVEYGTSSKGKPNEGVAAAKTGTAQTGIKIDDKPVIQAWFSGFYPADNPQYSIVVFAEDAKGGGESCGPAFKKIAQDIYYEILKR